MAERVILVDESDREVGTEDKERAHREGRLHRAFSVFVFNSRGEMLLQRRARGKYHSPGLWTNTCCSHPRPGESVEVAARRRLREEMGLECELRGSFPFLYRAELDRGMTEHEYDHVLVGECDRDPVPDADEVEAWAWVDPDEVRRDLAERPDRYTYWFRLALPDLLDRMAP
ncbi:MAG: isopentenyl-diphosphate Delta-isomerase [Gemmatimonadota bacterium]